MRINILLLLGIILLSCQKNSTSEKLENSDTKQLVQDAQNALDPMRVTYTFNAKRAEIYLHEANNLTGIPKLNKLIQYSLETINSGETKTGISTLHRVLEEIDKMKITDKSSIIQEIKKVLSIAYIRQGEQENCIQHHNHESCIIPIQQDGIHSLEEGSTKAIKLLEEILENEQDFQSQWLLNLAYMTLGTYPDEVPSEWLLDPSYFSQHEGKIGRFDNIASKLGIDHNKLSGSVIIEDFDLDGDLDIVCTSWGFQDEMIYYENDGAGSFQDKTSAKNLEGITGGLNIKQTDYNNDGRIDIYIMRGAWMLPDGTIPNTLLRNNLDGTFTDVTLQVGLTEHTPTQACAWHDLNKDGLLDLLVFNESKPGFQYPTQLWMNSPEGKFTNVGNLAGLTHTGFFKGVSVSDINNDNLPDIYVSTLRGNNLMYLNKGNNEQGVPQFVEVAKNLNITKPLIAFPNMIFDFNNDGNQDILVSSYESKIDNPAADFAMNINGQTTGGETLLYINKGDGSFEEVHEKVGLTEAIYTMGCNFGDINNDGWMDVYLGTGDPSFYSIVPNKMYLNKGGKQFLDVSYATGMGHIQKGHGVSMTDVDRDGHVDIYAVMGGAYEGDIFQNAFFHNPGNENNSITVKLIGTSSNSLAIGAKLKLTILENGKERIIYRTIDSGASFGCNSLEMVIGIGLAPKVEKLEILWPNKNNSTLALEQLQANKYYVITEGNPTVSVQERTSIIFKLDNKMHHH